METGPRVGGEKAASQSFSEREIQERERLEPQTLQGSLLTTLGPAEAQVGFLGQREGGRTRGGQVLGEGFRRDLGTCVGEPPSFQVKGKSFARSSLARSTQCLTQGLGRWSLDAWLCSPMGGGKEGLAFVPRRGADLGIHKAHLCASQGFEAAGKELVALWHKPRTVAPLPLPAV